MLDVGNRQSVLINSIAVKAIKFEAVRLFHSADTFMNFSQERLNEALDFNKPLPVTNTREFFSA